MKAIVRDDLVEEDLAPPILLNGKESYLPFDRCFMATRGDTMIDLSKWNRYIADDVQKIPRGKILEYMQITLCDVEACEGEDFPVGLKPISQVDGRIYWRFKGESDAH